jgi:2-polyprenyl-6-methoxyphenol hydroxylase-like FAD-dependent oxidoreductase
VVPGPAEPARPAGVPARAARRDEGDPGLTRERIVAAAIRVADAEGLAQLSMRRIATELSAAPMSLYRHVNGKDELLVSMMDSVLGEDPLPARPPKGWRAQLELSSRMQLAYDRRDVRAQQEILRAKFTGAGWLVPQILAAMPGAGDFYFDSLSQVHMGQWHRGRTVLLGDAAYCGSPLAGTGTATALVAAYVLAGELSATPGDHEAAFARYQDQMRDYVRQCQALPPGGVKGFAPNSALTIRMRNLSMTMTTRWPIRALIARQFHKADAITLKDY